LARSLERLASGSRINRASDDAAGLSILSTLSANSRVFTQGVRNLNDGISALSIADGSLESLAAITTRLQELAAQASNGTFDISQRRSLNSEADSLVSEFNRQIQSTKFNGNQLLSGQLALRIQAGFGVNGSIGSTVGGQSSRKVSNGTYTEVDPGTSELAFKMRSADFNGDGIPDMVSFNDSSILVVRYGAAGGAFGAEQALPSGMSGGGLDIGDFNGDGRIDVAATNTSGAVQILLNQGTSFTAGATYLAGTSASTIVARDFNSDGKVDLAAITGSGQISILNGRGDGTFSTGSVISAASLGAISDIGAGDFDGDGVTDLVALGSGATTLKIFRGEGNGTFSHGSSVSTGSALLGGTLAANFQIADLDRDGDDDIVGVTGAAVLVFSSEGGTLTRTQSLTQSGLGYGIQIVDINGDGRLDIAAGTQTSVHRWLNLANNSFSAQGAVTTGYGGQFDFLFVDMDKDGVLDVVSGENVRTLRSGTRYTGEAQYLNLASTSSARQSVDQLKEVLGRITRERGAIGATMSRFSVALAALRDQALQSETAAGRIRDADIASESASLVLSTIRRTAAASILSQANLQPQIALQLLSGSPG